MNPSSRDYSRIVNRLKLIRDSEDSLRKLLRSGKISESTYSKVSKIIERDESAMEERRKRILGTIEAELKELENTIESLEVLSARIEVGYAAGEINEETYEKKSNTLISGIDTLRNRLEDAREMLELSTAVPPRSREEIQRILKELPMDKAFYFYSNYGSYTGKYARSLEEFIEITKSIDAQSLRFHLTRGDFQSWISSRGDHELAEKLDSLKNLGLDDERLRKQIHSCANEHVTELKRLLDIPAN